jgi:hypothetical protein
MLKYIARADDASVRAPLLNPLGEAETDRMQGWWQNPWWEAADVSAQNSTGQSIGW